MDRFNQILYDLGTELGIDLYADANQLCQLNWQEELHIQLQYEAGKDRILIATFVCDVPPGKYREQLLRETLKHNSEHPRTGTFGYSERNNKLTLFEYAYGAHLTGKKFLALLEKFISKADEWKKAVEKGGPLPRTEKKQRSSTSIFGLKTMPGK